MAPCWRTRNCEKDMQSSCNHAITDWDMCPARCSFAQCDRPTYKLTSDPALVFGSEVDRDQALKQGCLWCTFFLENGPRKNPDNTPETADEKKRRLLQSE